MYTNVFLSFGLTRETYIIPYEKRPISDGNETCITCRRDLHHVKKRPMSYVKDAKCEKFQMYSNFDCPSVCQERPISYHNGKEPYIICKRDLLEIKKR